MKKGNQFFLELEITNEDDTSLDIRIISKVQFNIGDLTKTYGGESTEVSYNEGKFRIWLTEEETFKFENRTRIEARVLFTDNTILGTFIEQGYFYENLKEVMLSVEAENM